MSKEIRKTIFLVGLMIMGIVGIIGVSAISFTWIADKQVIETNSDLSVYGINKARIMQYYPFITDVTKSNGVTSITLSSEEVMLDYGDKKEELIRIIELTEDAEIQEKLTTVSVQRALVLKASEGNLYDCYLQELNGQATGWSCIAR